MTDDLAKLTADLLVAGPKAQAASYKALEFEAREMKDDWRGRVTGVRGLPGLAGAVSYDLFPTGLRELTAEVGYDKRGQGNLGNIAEFGNSAHGPIRPAGEPVLEAGADRLERFLTREVGDL